MELADYLRILRNHWLAVTAMVVVAAAVALGWSSLQPRVYAAGSSGFVTSGSGGDPGLDSLNDSLSKSRAASYVVLAKDRETASIVIDDLGLDTAPEALVGSIDAAQTPETVIIQITARAGTPEDAQELADAWVGALAERVADIEATEGDQGMRIEVSESAQLPTSPVSPQLERNVLLGAILGGLLGAGYAVARTLLDRRMRSTEDVERASKVAVVGTVPDLGKHSALFVTASGVGASTHAAEAIRRLRTNLSYMDVDDPPRAIVVTSPKQGDGKSTVAANLAAAIALSGQPVTLVDCDLRRPNVSRNLGLDDTVGLTDVLAGRVPLADAVQGHPEIPNLTVLTSGSRPPNPSEILGSKAMRGVIADLSARGMVVLDAPPLLPVTDAAVVAHRADGALVTVSAGRTLDTELASAIEHLHAVHARPLGVILNRVSRRNVGSGNYAHYGYAPDEYVETPVPTPQAAAPKGSATKASSGQAAPRAAAPKLPAAKAAQKAPARQAIPQKAPVRKPSAQKGKRPARP